MLLKRAYNLGLRQIFGPEWLDTQRYDIEAELPAGSDKEALRVMLQNLLAERFQMTLHRETRTLPVYLLTVTKGGPKFNVAKKDPEYKDFAALKAAIAARDAAVRRDQELSGEDPRRIGFHMDSLSTSQLADQFANYVELPVQDRTQLDGLSSIGLSWTPDDVLLSNPASHGLSIFAALEDQVSLKLQKENAPVDVLVIDYAEKVPTSN